MKKTFTTLVSMFALAALLHAQSPQQMNYQAVVRNTSGQPVANNTPVALRFTIHNATANGTAVYTETINTTANEFGLVAVAIGSTGSLGAVNWGNGDKFLQVEAQINNAGTFTDMGTSQLLSVPYALYAANSAAGPQGPQGVTGPQGAAGTPGATGPQGPQGVQGVAGATGPQGIQGIAGAQGIQGVTGATGATGTAGTGGGATGPTGPTGAQGTQGAQGLQGIQGIQGVAGSPGVQGATGPTGSQGLQGLQGIQGNAGAAGAPGATGATGTPGLTGPTGPSYTINSVTYNAAGTVSIATSIPSTITSTNAAWLTTGNSGTTAANNFIGTTDANALVVKTGGTAATNERLRFLSTPQIIVNRVTPQTGDLFSVYGSGYAGIINTVANQTDFPIAGYSVGTGSSVFGENGGTGQGVVGVNTSSGQGVYGQNANAAGAGTVGDNTSSGAGVFAISASGNGLLATTNSTTGSAVRGVNTNTAGVGLVGLGNNITAGTSYASGAGVLANGTAVGTISLATTASGVGLIGIGGSATSNTSGMFEGVSGNGVSLGLAGFATGALANDRFGGYFDFLNSTNGYAFVGGRTGGIDYAILSAGTKSTMVTDEQNRNRVMFCTEAPEVLFQDFGEGKLVNGKAHISMDPLFTRNIAADKPIKVFIQLEGECKGTYVANKSATGFDVVELNGGTSNVSFTWQVVGNRANTVDASGNVTNAFSDARFPVGPARADVQTQQAVKMEPTQMPNLTGNSRLDKNRKQ